MTGDWKWVRVAAILVAIQHATAILISRAVAFPNTPPTASYVVMAMVLSTTGGVALTLHYLFGLWRAGVDRPIAHILEKRSWAVALPYYAGFLLVALQIAALTWLKEMIPFAIPYWADPELARFDRLLLTTDAWRLIPNVAISTLDVLYTTWAPFKFFALILMLASPASRLKSQAMLSYFLTVGLLGVAGEYVLSSGGPIFFDRLVGGNEFAALLDRTREQAPIAYTASGYLWESFQAVDTRIGNGISAMPSMHVATTAWAALALSAKWRIARIPVWSYFAIILAGSVGLGWHYLSDGLVGGIGAYGCWKLAPYLLGERRADGTVSPPVGATA